ncbi:hypothetical protein GGR55DRAFT_521039 [Xylaria sp. FL0064]|nr:hypothetical protein GGR55DRAFT_521039 [Xylaria sp. FL0064]
MLGAHGQRRTRWQQHYIASDDGKANGHWEYLPNKSPSGYRAIERVNRLRENIQTYVNGSALLEAFIERLLTWLYDVRLKLPCDLRVHLTTHRGHAAVEIAAFDHPPSHLFRSEDLCETTRRFVSELASENPYVAPADFAIYWLLANRQPVNPKHLEKVYTLPWTSGLRFGKDKVGYHFEIEEAHEKLIFPLPVGKEEPKEVCLRLRMKRREKKKDDKNPVQAQSEEAEVPLPHSLLIFRKGQQGFFISLIGEEEQRFVFHLRREVGRIVIKRWHEEEVVAHYGPTPNFFRRPQFDLHNTLQCFPRLMPKKFLIHHPAALKLGIINAPGNDGTDLDGVVTDCYDHEYQRDPIAIPLEGDRYASVKQEFGWL